MLSIMSIITLLVALLSIHLMCLNIIYIQELQPSIVVNISSIETVMEKIIINRLNLSGPPILSQAIQLLFSSMLASLMTCALIYILSQRRSRHTTADIACQTDKFYPETIYIPYPQVGRGRPMPNFRQ
jgi:hypothetical protein